MIGFIGGGNMAEAMIKGIFGKHGRDIMVSEPRDERRAYLEYTYKINTTSDNKEVVKSCNIIILAVKPQNMDSVSAEISDAISSDKIVVSIAAGITLSYLSSRLKTSKIIRVMPNTPALVQEGMSVLSMCECIHDKEMNLIRDIFMSIGKVMVLPEKYMDAVTALSGSGPAFFAYFVEAMIEGGIRMGLTRDNAPNSQFRPSSELQNSLKQACLLISSGRWLHHLGAPQQQVLRSLKRRGLRILLLP